QGTRENPYPLGSTITNDEWSITVNSYTADATAQVKEANMFNEDPAEGTTYALVNLTVTREGADEASPMFDVGVDYVTAAGNVVTRGDAFVVAPDALSDNELFTGASATGNIALQVPADDAGVLRVKAGMFDDGVFVATS
ncbi:MAG: hypothetical protein Q4F65_05335, partial [Propionibacteriaceae bacterium]|nr:hypothetical protein [Propionibacteriaceae bacterium]